jgi:phosphatidylserine decarboxylase
MIKVYNRKKKDYEIEKVAGGGLLKALYGTWPGRLGLELLVKRKLYSSISGIYCDTRFSTRLIRKFIDGYGIDMSECADSVESFKSFNSFFSRRMKPQARPFPEEPDKLLSPGDGRMFVWTDIDKQSLLQVKGFSYTMEELLGDSEFADLYNGGILVLLRLCPVDYHRFHFIDSGVCSEVRKIKGSYYSVNPVALKSIPRVFCRNKREISVFKSDNFGDILYIEVGATSVGSIVQTYEPGISLKRGAEKGYFKFGGSTVILLLKKGAASIDKDILRQTELGYETKVLAGEVIGEKNDTNI